MNIIEKIRNKQKEYNNNILKFFGIIEKGQKDLLHLQKKVIIDKNAFQRTVYVKQDKEENKKKLEQIKKRIVGYSDLIQRYRFLGENIPLQLQNTLRDLKLQEKEYSSN
jgi:DNA gyrase/topoisomerase IV subunit B